jgi:8-oxo-dGTP pyrophosphatase MutT (NUDIX family)
MTASRGGPQFIPRPDRWAARPHPPWSADLPDLDSIAERIAGRGPARPSPVEDRGATASAVAVLWYPDDAGAGLVLTRRAWHLRTHRGEVSFPGGGREDADRSHVDTALRETHEEIGLAPRHVEVIGELDHLTTHTSDRYIVPVVGIIDHRPDVRPDPAEVDDVLFVPLSELTSPEVFREERWGGTDLAGSGDGGYPMFFFELMGDTVWGATAAIITRMLTELLTDGR